MKYRVYALLPRTLENLQVFEDTVLDNAIRYCEKNIKYFPKLTLTHGSRGLSGYLEEFYENSEFKDRCRDHIADSKIGRIRKKPRFESRIIFEDERQVGFLVRYKKNEARVCIVDQEDKDVVFGYLRARSDCFRIKIYRKALPIVYFRHHAKLHTTMPEIIFNRKKFGYMNFRDGNPYNYMKSNVFFTKVATTRERPKPSTGYYGVTYKPDPSRKQHYVARIKVDGKMKRIGRYLDALTAAKAYDRVRMQMHGKHSAKNFPYEYYAAFEPIYVEGVK